MTVKERNTLNTLKKEILYTLDLDGVSNIELFNFLNEYNYYLEDLDISTMSDLDKKYILDDVAGYLDEKVSSNKLEKLLEYIHEKDYDLNQLLYFTNYTENDIDTTALSSKEISHIADELEVSISEYEYQLELHDFEEQISSIENQQNELQDLAYEFNIETENNNVEDNQLRQLEEEKNRLQKELQALKENHEQINREALIKEIQAKRYLSPKELAILKTDMSISSQQTYRGRLRDKIPFHQKGRDCKITYDIKEVEVWIENQNWKHK